MITHTSSIAKHSSGKTVCEQCRKPVLGWHDRWTLASDPDDHDPSPLLHDRCLSAYWQRVVDEHGNTDAARLKSMESRLGVRRAVTMMLGAVRHG